jgi:CHAT domain-containing protein
MQLNKQRPGAGFEAAALKASELARARNLIEMLVEAHADIRQGITSELLDQERLLQSNLDRLAERQIQLLAAEHTAAQTDSIEKELRTLGTQYEELETKIRQQSPRYAALMRPQPIGLEEIQRQVLDDQTLLLEYALGDQRSYLWAVTRDQVKSYELPGRAEIEEKARNVHALLTANQPLQGETFEQRQARVAKADEQLPFQIANLSKTLLAPVSDRLGTKRLLIVPDGALQYIPFQILNTGNDQRPLVADHEIVNEPSASTLALLVNETRNRKPASNSVAVLADPVFEADDPRINSVAKPAATSSTAQVQETEFHQALSDVSLSGNGRIPRLLASRAEAEAIISVAPWRSGFQALGFDASRATMMKADLSDYRIVHFATHGLLNNEHPELSGIVLSLFDQKGQPQDGYLRLHDIYNLRLPVDLVVLSACNTGLGKDVKGEGLIGLTRGFMYAGASSVVASLWKVDDEATAELMRHFYGYMLRDGLSPAAALRKAQVTMSQQKRWQSPYYWAGFVIQGQYLPSPRVNRFPVSRAALWLVAAALVSAAAFYGLRRRRKIIL